MYNSDSFRNILSQTGWQDLLLRDGRDTPAASYFRLPFLVFGAVFSGVAFF